MSRVCELSGVSVMSGHKVSHSEIKTKRKFLPNLRNVFLASDLLGIRRKFRVIARVLRTIEVYGGLDNYLLKTQDKLLSSTALEMKRRIKTLQSSK